jgi:parallel beta-helix repeat protein
MEKVIFWSLAALLLFQCSTPEREGVTWKSIEKDLQTRFITADDNSVIEIPEGNYLFKKSLLIDGKTNVTIRGAGAGKTVLSFAYQEEGAEGLKISNCTNVKFENFTIEDAPGDNIKATDTHGITFSGIVSQWNGKPKESNGAYAFYPVLCKNVLIENCKAIGASDAGIYVGQSDSVIIRSNVVYKNVAGIESENSRWVEIYKNEAFDNTGGILVFDLPGLTQYGHTTRVYGNVVRSNNLKNFAPEGNIVASVPPGTGIMLLATRKIDIFENLIQDNRTMGVGIASYDLVEAMKVEEGTGLAENIAVAQQDTQYDPYPNSIYIYDNKISNKHLFPTTKSDFGLLFLTKFPLSTPDIVFDGIVPEAVQLELCLQNNGEAKFAYLDAGNSFENLRTGLDGFECEREKIGPLGL